MDRSDFPELYSYDLFPEEGDKVYVEKGSIAWFDKNGIYISVPFKEVVPMTIDDIKLSEENWLKNHGTSKICMISVVHPQAPSTKEMRDYMALILPNYLKAFALISSSALGRMAANIFFGLKPQSYPAKMFSNPDKAKRWLINYL